MALNQALLDKLKANKEKFAKSAGKAFKFPEGRTIVRFLPNPLSTDENPLDYHQQLAVHWIKADENGKPLAVVGDVEYTFEDGRVSEITPMISEAVSGAKAAGDEEAHKLFKSWYARKSVLVNALIRVKGKPDDLQIVEMTPTLFSDIQAAALLNAEEGIDVMDLKDGIDFVVERTGKMLDTTYNLMTMPRSLPVDPKIMEKVHDLKAYVIKEHFRAGETEKALAAITKLTGVTASAAIVAPRGNAMLRSTIAAAPETELAQIEAPKAASKPAGAKAAPQEEVAPTAPKEAPAPLSADDADIESMLADLDNLV